MATLLETAQGLKDEALDAWLESLTFKEQVELWTQTIEATLDILDQLAEYHPEEVCDGEVPSNDKGQEGTQSAQLEACCDAFWRGIFHRAKAPTRR